MLPVCLEVPSNDLDWERWAWHSKGQIDSINEAIQQKYGIVMTSYVLIPFTKTQLWLQNNASAHSAFCAVLGIDGHNIDDLNWEDADEVAVWVDLAYRELADASFSLGI